MYSRVAVRGILLTSDGEVTSIQIPRAHDDGLCALQTHVNGLAAVVPVRYVGDCGLWATAWFNEEAALDAGSRVSALPSLIAPLFVLPVNVLFGPVVVLGPPTPDGDIEPVDDLVEQVIRRHAADW